MYAFIFSDANSDIFSERYSCLNMLVRNCGDQHTHVPNVTFACTLTRTLGCHRSQNIFRNLFNFFPQFGLRNIFRQKPQILVASHKFEPICEVGQNVGYTWGWIEYKLLPMDYQRKSQILSVHNLTRVLRSWELWIRSSVSTWAYNISCQVYAELCIACTAQISPNLGAMHLSTQCILNCLPTPVATAEPDAPGSTPITTRSPLLLSFRSMFMCWHPSSSFSASLGCAVGLAVCLLRCGSQLCLPHFAWQVCHLEAKGVGCQLCRGTSRTKYSSAKPFEFPTRYVTSFASRQVASEQVAHPRGGLLYEHTGATAVEPQTTLPLNARTTTYLLALLTSRHCRSPLHLLCRGSPSSALHGYQRWPAALKASVVF